jgi:hypothetical protein
MSTKESEEEIPWHRECLKTLDLGEKKVEYDSIHYPSGLNHDFLRDDVSKDDRLAQYIIDGEGKFESPEKR